VALTYAYNAVKTENVSVCRTSNTFGVPEQNLRDRVKGIIHVDCVTTGRSSFHYIRYIYCLSGPNFTSSYLKPPTENVSSQISIYKSLPVVLSSHLEKIVYMT
jgi:hypothetical protein